jgi:hypothetical protein
MKSALALFPVLSLARPIIVRRQGHHLKNQKADAECLASAFLTISLDKLFRCCQQLHWQGNAAEAVNMGRVFVES